MRLIVQGLLCALILTGCGSGDKVAPQLSAPPTRTPVPATDSPAGGEQTGLPENIRVVSLRGAVDSYLTASADVGALDRVDVFSQTVITPNPACFVGSLFPDSQPLELLAAFNLNLPEANPVAWLDAVTAFSEEALIEQTNEALSRAAALLPLDVPLTICMMPFPVVYGFEGEPHFTPGILSNGQGDSVLMTCLGEIDPCIERWALQTAYEYAVAYQYLTAGRGGLEIPLLDFAVYFGRASDFARQLYPDAVLPWDYALTPEQEADVWSRMQDYLQTTYSDYPGYRNVDRFLYGSDNPARYPAWGGIYIGERIVQAYRAAHPDMTPAELMALAPADLLAASGYAPVASS